MATFDALIDDLASRFGLGVNARTLVKEVLAIISTSPGGFSGFLDKLKSGGLEVASWLGRPDAAPIAAGQVERALGPTALSGIADRLGVGQSAVSTALGYALPKIVGLLTPAGSSGRGACRGRGVSFAAAGGRGGSGTGRAEADRRSPGEPAKQLRRRALALAGARYARRHRSAFVLLVNVRPDATRAGGEGAGACGADNRRPGADPAAGSRASSASPSPAASAGNADRRPCPGCFDERTSDRSARLVSNAAACSGVGCAGDVLSSAGGGSINRRSCDSYRSASFTHPACNPGSRGGCEG